MNEIDNKIKKLDHNLNTMRKIMIECCSSKILRNSFYQNITPSFLQSEDGCEIGTLLTFNKHSCEKDLLHFKASILCLYVEKDQHYKFQDYFRTDNVYDVEEILEQFRIYVVKRIMDGEI